MTVKTRRQGNSIMVTIPASFNIGENVEYQPIIDENGVISLLPVKHNIFKSEPDYDLRKAMLEENIGDNGTLVGREDAWHE
ncbi:type II toxin-antitoxin system PemI/MazE family antitoxin [Lacticaseibacillus paracasei]|uniref:type II toxin-antitoxin system PemI/MazE family antitoxin n=1 Tax=Lacticaseibacillus paracasei TaxID=1597 RepID=UPI0007BF67C2|nr:hypothetical protein [Lacticaseibacillus paracasei]